MLKTNSKKVRDAVCAWIVKCTNGYERDPKTIEEACAIIEDAWNRWKCPYVKEQFNNLQDAFVDWSRGLPNNLFDYWDYAQYGGMVDFVGNLLEQTPEERAKYTNDQAATLFTKLIYREVSERARITF